MAEVTQPASLRARLTVIILFPLLALAVLAGLWQLGNARRTAADVFDRSLLSAALAVANDVAVSDGDALSPQTRDILSSTSGGQVFYHVFAPDGVIVAGYATPPVGIPSGDAQPSQPTYFKASYLGRDVSGVRLQVRTEIDDFSGVFTTTVWQDRAVRTAFVRDLVLRTAILISSLIASLALIVWFGVRLGLRPLLDLENAIAQRSTSDLSPIRRGVPEEAQGIVATLNRLFGQVTKAMTAQSEFVANAAHQLRNPIAGVLSLAEAVVDAPSSRQQKERAHDLLDAAREAAELSQKLLMLERAEALTPQALLKPIDLDVTVEAWLSAFRDRTPARVAVDLETDGGAFRLLADELMLNEALTNLIDNSVIHGGDALSRILISLHRVGEKIRVDVSDDGRGLPDADFEQALTRFALISDTSTSGLGLSIVQAVAEGHGGSLGLIGAQKGLCARIELFAIPDES
ncbi:MAG: sensor histidine kinase N-terminal domain-containing protein [Arenibacterium sp.]